MTDPNPMIERARRIVVDPPNDYVRRWAEALLVERQAREEAERERDQAWAEAARSRDEASAWFNKRADAKRRAERAERERDEWKARAATVAITRNIIQGRYEAESRRAQAAEARVGVLTAALREVRDAYDDAEAGRIYDVTALMRANRAARAALVGEQEAPTEPIEAWERYAMDAEGYAAPQVAPVPEPERLGRTDWIPPMAHPPDVSAPQALAAPQEATTEPTCCTGMTATWCPIHGDCTCDRDTEHDTGPDFASGEGTCPLHALASMHAAPQVAPPEPERCPTCGSVSRRSLCYSNPLRPDPWHRPVPLVATGNCEDDCQTACAYPGQFSECSLGAADHTEGNDDGQT